MTPRFYFFLGFVFCAGLLLIAAYFQFVEDLEPCPLCISQRIAVLIVAIILLIAVIHNPKHIGIRIYAVLGALAAILGAGVAGRHVWLQNLPPEEIPVCGPGLTYIFENFPITETIKLLLNGTGECADVLWTFLGLSIPGWTLAAFILLALVSLYQFWNINSQSPSSLK